MLRLTEWRRKLIEQIRWCILKSAFDDLYRGNEEDPGNLAAFCVVWRHWSRSVDNVDNADKSTLIWYDSVSRLSVCDGWIGNTTASVQHPARFSVTGAVWLWWWRGLSRAGSKSPSVLTCRWLPEGARWDVTDIRRYGVCWCQQQWR